MINKIKETEIESNKMSNVPTRPNSTGLYGDKPLSSKDLKERMDALSLLAISKLNEIIEGMAAGGEVAKTIKFNHGDKEYSLSELFSMIFKPENGLSDVLKTSYGESLTLNSALANIMSAMQTEYASRLEISFSEGHKLQIKLLNKNEGDLGKYGVEVRVNSEGISDGAVTTKKITDQAVTGAKLESDVIEKLNSAFKKVEYDASNGHLTFINSNGDRATIDLPLELIVKSGRLDRTEDNEAIVLVLNNGEEISIPIKDFVDKFDERFSEIEADMGKVDEAISRIIDIQESLIGGEAV